jgi:hypothetical protein
VLLVYTPENGERQEFPFRPLEINNVDAEDVEEVGGTVWDDFDDFDRAFRQGKTRALRAALWVSLRATQPDLTFDDVHFKLGEVDVFLEDEERERIRQAIAEGLVTGDDARLAEAAIAIQPPGKDEPAASDTNST